MLPTSNGRNRPGLILALTATLASGCGGSALEQPARATARSPTRVELPRVVVTPHDDGSLPELWARARQWLEDGDAARAAAELDRLVSLDPGGASAPELMHEAALAHERAGDRGAALDRFEALARRYPKHALARDALLRAIRLAGFLEEWRRAERLADELLARYTDLQPIETVVARGGRALGLLAAGAVDQASMEVERGRNVIEAHRLDAAGVVSRDLAQLYYALGEVRRVRGEKIRFDPVPPNFGQVLEERCQLLLDAQRAYSDAMRAYDAHWSAMSGFRVGELYQRLHQDLMAMPRPATADTEARRQLFEGAIRLRYSVLLDKGLAMMDHTLTLAERTGERSRWIDKARAAKAQLSAARQSEQAALDRLPYTREQLQQALRDLAEKKKKEKQTP